MGKNVLENAKAGPNDPALRGFRTFFEILIFIATVLTIGKTWLKISEQNFQ